MLSRIKKRHIALVSMLILLSTVGIFYLNSDQATNSSGIRTYDHNRDYATLVALINANKFLLSENANFSPEKFLTLRAPNMDPERQGEARIDVVEVEDKVGGFIAFYLKNPTQGFIWLVAVDQKYRGQGLGERLTSHALKILKQQGAKSAYLHTRLVNKPALKLYQKLGFVEQSRYENRGMITLIKRDL